MLHNTTHQGWGQLSRQLLEPCKDVSRTYGHDFFLCVFCCFTFFTGDGDYEVQKIYHSLTQKPRHQSILIETKKCWKSRSWDKWVPIWKKWGGSEQKIHNTALTSMLINQTRTFPLSRIPSTFTQHCLCAHSLLLDIFIVFEIMDISHAIGGCNS